MAQLSIFIDESGDFGKYDHRSPYYLLTLVFHNQDATIASQVEHLKRHAEEAGFSKDQAIHAGPLIRREDIYRNAELPSRRKLFRNLFDFVRICDIHYKTFVYRKNEFSDRDVLVKRMSRDLSAFVREHLEFFQSFEGTIVYYDDGQKEISTIINAVFNALVDADIRKVNPADYCLFQAADMICTLELVREKCKQGLLSKSETEFFRGQRNWTCPSFVDTGFLLGNLRFGRHFLLELHRT